MYQVMMKQISNDRINNARQQGEAHRKALQARAASQANMRSASAIDKALISRISGIASGLMTALKQLKVRRVFTHSNVN